MTRGLRRGLTTLAVGAAVLGVPATAGAAGVADLADQWLPRTDGASWTYEWSDSEFAPKRTRERYTLARRDGASFRLAWTTEGLGNGEGTVRSAGEVDYRQTDAGLVTLNWQSTPPPPQFPILCPSPSECANSMAGTHYLVIWGNRSPVVQEPLVRGATWSSLGGANNDVSSASRYVGRERIAVPAFPRGVLASKVETEVTQAGALGDPYGSGLRTVWWVRGVGPVRVSFRHAGGQVSSAELMQTSLVPKPAPSDAAYFPLQRGTKMRFRWRNSEHLRQPSRQELTVQDVVNGTARIDVRDLSGPVRVRGSYLLSSRLSGVTALSGQTRSATRATIPGLGPRKVPAARRRKFRTPLDLLAFGFNPVLTAYPSRGQSWKSSRTSRDWRVYGVTGETKVLGTETIRTPAGKLRALAVRSTLRQPGFAFGSGTRTAWFAPGKGLVRLVFRHADGSTSTVERLP
jgi:hypothetical protein